MIKEFFEEAMATQSAATERPDVQQFARAIQESIPPASRRTRQGGLTYPLPGKGVSGGIEQLMLSREQFDPVYEYNPDSDVHSLHVERPEPNAEGLTRSYIEWSGHTADTPGEIQSVSSAQRGDASKLHARARQMAEEDSFVPMPQHSSDVTPEGRAWAEKERKKYGESSN